MAVHEVTPVSLPPPPIGAVAVAEFIAESPRLLRLDLRENEIKTGGLMALALALKVNQSLLRLDLDRDPKKEAVRGGGGQNQGEGARRGRDVLKDGGRGGMGVPKFLFPFPNFSSQIPTFPIPNSPPHPPKCSLSPHPIPFPPPNHPPSPRSAHCFPPAGEEFH